MISKNSWSPKKRSSLKLRWIFRPKSEIETDFPPKNRWFRKKKGLHQNWNEFFGQNRKFILFFRPNRGNSFTTLAPKSLWAAVFVFWAKIGLKSTKNVRFCILYRPMGKLDLPQPPLAMRAKSTDRDKLTAKRRFRYSDFVTDFVAVILSQS